MIKSMTGYGKGESDSDIGHCSVEISSCNHRYCDISVHMPRRLTMFENPIKTLIKERFSRGHFDVYVSLNFLDNPFISLNVDYQLIEDYVAALKEMKKKFKLEGEPDLQTVSKLKDVWKIEDGEYEEDAVGQLIEKTVKNALESLGEMREQEGKLLYQDIAGRIDLIKGYMETLEKELPGIMETYRTRLREKIDGFMGELNTSVDEARIAQEVAIMGEKSDVTEEVIRIDSHLKQFLDLIGKEEPAGRKLDFLIQEINREVNTISSKISDLSVSNFVVEIKSELEKIREQIQNVE